MRAHSHSTRSQRRAAVTLEWIMLISVIILGTAGGVALVRNALIEEYQELLQTICQMSVGP
jgi:hypothetical protein